MHIFLVTYNIMKKKGGYIWTKRKKQSFDEEFAPEISPDIGKMYISHLNIKHFVLMGITILLLYCLCLSFSFILMEGDLLYEETRFQSFKRTVKTEKGYAGDSVLTQNKLSKEIYILLKRNWSTK